VVAPHPDDETLGCGGAILKHCQKGDAVHWVIATEMRPEDGYAEVEIARRRVELDRVTSHYGCAGRHELGMPASRLDALPLRGIVRAVAEVIAEVRPSVVYLPFPGDAHSDHRIVFSAAGAALKWFRAPGVERILAYETPSETGFDLDPRSGEFRPNWFVSIKDQLEDKLAAMAIYEGEMGDFPFPRSGVAIEALAKLRGSHCGYTAAEAFVLLRGME
jgi:LmbE family N-acetylglucosaminyl deacetylase